jgi:glycosyltransferase involved in cell wall biosynthesis
MNVRFAWVTDIPTPYRNHLYERMGQLFPSYGIDLTVHFMTLADHRRPWRFAPEELRYPWKVHGEPVSPLRRRAIHLNPSLLVELGSGRADVAMIGGWASPSHVAAAYVMPKRVLKILGCESHLGSVGRVGTLARAVKRSVVRQYDGFLVPGARSRALIVSLDEEAAQKPFVTLPNVIDAGQFRDGVATRREGRTGLRCDLGIADDVQMWLWPARFIAAKGLVEFLPLLAGLRGVELLIAGDGELRPEVERIVARERLPVRLLGQLAPERMVALYAAADLFVLPSLSDPSPLSGIEAAAAGLPLLMSDHCGNVDDLVDEGVNGWVYEIDGGPRRRALLERIAAMPRAALAAMGPRSRGIYEARFDTDTCVRGLAEFIVEQWQRRTSARAA